MNEYRILPCISGYVIYKSNGPGVIQDSWAFTTAVEAADKLLELMQVEEAKDAP